MNHDVFVFGSNLAGIHGAGAALYAHKHYGAPMGKGVGLMGGYPTHSGFCYAIPTKNRHLESLDLGTIEMFVKNFLRYANQRHDVTFQLTPIGCGLAGFEIEEIAPMFVDAPANVLLPDPDYDRVSKEFTEFILNARAKRLPTG